jgi:maltose O-acetyltransferase
MDEASSYERMLRGEKVFSPDWDLIGMQMAGQAKLAEFNALPTDRVDERRALLQQMLGKVGEGCMVLGTMSFEYGKHIELGTGVLLNFECMFLDGAKVIIGDFTLVAPRVQFLTATHPTLASERFAFDEATGIPKGGYTINKTITVGSWSWIGAGAILMPGVTVGDHTVIGAGSVVTKDIPSHVVAAGNPCRVIRPNA